MELTQPEVDVLTEPLGKDKGTLPPAMRTRQRTDLMERFPAMSNRYVAASLAEWRRKAIDVALAVSAVIYLPPVILQVFGQIIPLAWTMQAVFVTSYLTLVAVALLQRVDSRFRVWAHFGAGYLMAITGTVALPHGPFVRILPVAWPVILLVLIGPCAARFATAVSIPVILFAPFLRRLPGLTKALSSGPHISPESTGTLLVQGAALTATLLALMVMLERFHRFLIRTLAAQHQATAEAQQEATELAAAHRSLAREMNERRRLEREIARIGDEERRRLGQDVHDGVCQQLTGTLLRCEALQRRLGKGETLASGELSEVSSLLKDAIDEAHAVAQGLSPLEQDARALAEALRLLAKRTQQSSAIRCDFIATGNVLVNEPATAQHLYRIAQEALINAARHSQARLIVVELRGDDGELLLQVQDDGVGPPADIPPGRMGLRTMASRAQMIDGELTVTRGTEGGTRLSCRVPRHARRWPDDELPEKRERETSGS